VIDSAHQEWVPVPGGQVFTARYGSGNGSALVVLHGGPGMPSYYLEPLADLADERDVILFDQLGCGRSERPDNPRLWTVERAVEEVEAVRRTLGLGAISLLGHSWGGFLALAYTAVHPANVSALVLSSPLVSVDLWMQDAARLVARVPASIREKIAQHEAEGTFSHPDYQAATMAFYKKFFCKLEPWPANLQLTFQEMGQQPYEVMWGPSEFSQTGNLRGQDLTPDLANISIPSLWICGTQDEVIPSTLERFARIAGGQTCVIDGGTHCLHLEHPAEYLRVVASFLARTGQPNAEGTS
jgi:proline-specific peptidase